MVHECSPVDGAAALAGSLLIGRDKQGHWVVRDGAGLWGGVFFDRREAVIFALSENGHRPDAIVMVPWPLELLPSSDPSRQADKPVAA